jgi:hypothetical protein
VNGRQTVNWVMDGIERLVTCEPRSLETWSHANPELEQLIVHDESPDGGVWMHGDTQSAATGLIVLENARIISMARRNREFFKSADPAAREVFALTSLGRPVSLGRPPLLFRCIPGWLRRLVGGGPERPSVRSTRLEGRVALLSAYYGDCNNYYHFWTDAVADYWYLGEMGIDLQSVDYFLMPFGRYGWQRQILKICGIPESKVLPLCDFSHLRVSELILPIRPKGGLRSPVWLARALRQQADWTPASGPGLRRIYVSRLDAQRRRLINEQEVITYLEGHGFEIHQCSTLSVEEQQRLFASAGVIIAPHGAALTNIVWSNPGTRLVEFLSVKHLNPCFRDLARANQMPYSAIVCELADPTLHGLTGDTVLSLTDLEPYVEQSAEPA